MLRVATDLPKGREGIRLWVTSELWPKLELIGSGGVRFIALLLKSTPTSSLPGSYVNNPLSHKLHLQNAIREICCERQNIW